MASFIKPREENPISNSLQEALIYLNKQTIEEGKIYSRRYFSNSTKTAVDVVLAVGTVPGVGPSHYSIISHSKKVVVWGVSDSLPDVSEVTLGRLHIYWDSNQGRSYIVYLSAGDRIVEPISFPLIVFNIEDSHLYYVSEQAVVDIYEHLDGVFDMEERLSTLEKKVNDLINGGGSEDEPEEDEPGTDENTTTPPPTIITTPMPIPPSVTLNINSFKTSDNVTQYEVGQVINPKLVWSYNTAVDSQRINGTSIDASLRETTFNNVTSDITYTLSATAGSTTKTKSVSIEFSPKVFIGFSDEYEIADVNSESFKEIFLVLDSKEEGLSNEFCKGSVEKTFTINKDDSSIMMAFPLDIASNLVIIDVALNSPVNCYKKDITVTNDYGKEVTYKIFESPSIYASGTIIKWKFNFN